jgi:hypothetical protein
MGIREFFADLLRNIVRLLQNQGDEHAFFRWFVLLPTNLLYLFLSPSVAFLALVFSSLYDVMLTDTIPRGATHTPTFYSPRTDSEGLSFFIVLPLFGFVFGGIHCLGWNLVYPSQAEKTIWHVASLTVTLTPPISTLFGILGFLMGDIQRREGNLGNVKYIIESATKVTLFVLAVFPASIYVLARIVLLMEALALLRHQPTAAFQAVSWTEYLPHAISGT